MIELRAGRPSDLLAVRFATSPIWETTSAVRRSAGRDGRSGLPRWREAAAAGRLDLAPLLAVNPRSGYVPDFLTPPPPGPAPRFSRQLAEVRRTPLERVASELARVGAGAVDPDDRAVLERLLADPAAARTALADAVEQAWRALVAPHWPRIRALLSADVAHRSRLLAEHGLGRVLDGLDPRVRRTGSAIAVDVAADAAVELDERGLVLMPSAFVWPGVVAIVDEPWQPTLVYPARGVGRLWQEPPHPAEALARLLGATRARILVALEAPASTTALAASLGLSPSGTSRHLLALRDAGLLAATRQGHEVRYARTRLGTALLRRGR